MVKIFTFLSVYCIFNNIMVKRTIFFLIFLYLSFHIVAQDEDLPVVGIVPPLIINESTGTVFFNEQFLFEMMSVVESDKYSLEIISVPSYTDEVEYFEESKVEILRSGYDYLLYAKTYSLEDVIFFSVKLLNPYSNETFFSRIYSSEIDYTMTEHLSDICSQVALDMEQQNIIKVATSKKNKLNDQEREEKEREETFTYDKELKNEFFVMTGLFKNNPQTLSFISIYVGMSFNLLENILFEFAFFSGAGQRSDVFQPDNSYGLDEFYFGGYFGIYVFSEGIMEPNFGLRLDLLATPYRNILLSIPLDVGFKLYVTKKNVIRVRASFAISPYNVFDIYSGEWKKLHNFGILIGYGRKM